MPGIIWDSLIDSGLNIVCRGVVGDDEAMSGTFLAFGPVYVRMGRGLGGGATREEEEEDEDDAVEITEMLRESSG